MFEPLLTADTHVSFSSLMSILSRANFGGNSSRLILHADLVNKVVRYLTIEKVVPSEVTVLGCSSSDKSHPISECLSSDLTTWWISGPNSMINGLGREFVEFQMGSQCELRRLSRVGVSIPPLPAGPLSVREFVLEAPAVGKKGHWKAVSVVLSTRNVSGMQYFQLPPPGIDVDRVRFTCLSNHLSSFGPTDTYRSVGFFTVKFDGN